MKHSVMPKQIQMNMNDFWSTCVAVARMHAVRFSGMCVIICKVSSRLRYPPQSPPFHQAPIPCLMKGSPLLHISSTARQGDKGDCWSNTQRNHQWQKHTFVARHLALISWLYQEPKGEATQTVNPHSLSYDPSVQIAASFTILLHKSAYIFSQTAGGWTMQGGAKISPSPTENKPQVMLKEMILEGGSLVGWQSPIIVNISTVVTL